MSQAKVLNPGNVNVRLGSVLAAYEAAVDQGDLARASNHLRQIRTYLGIYMTPSEKKGYEALPGYATGDHRSPQEVFDDMEERREYLLRVAMDHNVFARGEPETGDASELDDVVPVVAP